jgi:hypothetical protein
MNSSLQVQCILRKLVNSVIGLAFIMFCLDIVLVVFLIVSILSSHEFLSEIFCEFNVFIHSDSGCVVLSLSHQIFFVFAKCVEVIGRIVSEIFHLIPIVLFHNILGIEAYLLFVVS